MRKAILVFLALILCTATGVVAWDFVCAMQVRRLARWSGDVDIAPGGAGVRPRSRDAGLLLLATPSWWSDGPEANALKTADQRPLLWRRIWNPPYPDRHAADDWQLADLWSVWSRGVLGAACGVGGAALGWAMFALRSPRSAARRARISARAKSRFLTLLAALPVPSILIAWYLLCGRSVLFELLSREIVSGWIIASTSVLAGWTAFTLTIGPFLLLATAHAAPETCPGCRYPGVTRGRCPECGTVRTRAASTRAQVRRARKVSGLGAMAACAVGVSGIATLAVVSPVRFELAWRWLAIAPLNRDPLTDQWIP